MITSKIDLKKASRGSWYLKRQKIKKNKKKNFNSQEEREGGKPPTSYETIAGYCWLIDNYKKFKLSNKHHWFA